jgi:hypothetical protein
MSGHLGFCCNFGVHEDFASEARGVITRAVNIELKLGGSGPAPGPLAPHQDALPGGRLLPGRAVLPAGITESVLEEQLSGGRQRRRSGRLGMRRNGPVSGAAAKSAALVGTKGAGTGPWLAAVPPASSRVIEVHGHGHHSARFEGQHRRLSNNGRHDNCT